MKELEEHNEVEFTAVAPAPRVVRMPDLAPIVEQVKQRVREWRLGLAGTAVGLGIGLYIGWWAWPVEWTHITFSHLETSNQVVAVEVMADLNAYGDGRPSPSLLRMAAQWSGVEAFACGMAISEIENQNFEDAARLIALAYSIGGNACGMEGEQ